MINQLPALAAAVGIFVRAYGSWPTASLVRLPLRFTLSTCSSSCFINSSVPHLPSASSFPDSSLVLMVSSYDCWAIHSSRRNCKTVIFIFLKCEWKIRKKKEEKSYTQQVGLLPLEHYS